MGKKLKQVSNSAVNTTPLNDGFYGQNITFSACNRWKINVWKKLFLKQGGLSDFKYLHTAVKKDLRWASI